jgi:hypothetical protein
MTKDLTKAEPTVTLNLTVTTIQEVADRFLRMLAIMQRASSIGHSNTFGMYLDGDGADRFEVEGVDLPKVGDDDIMNVDSVEAAKAEAGADLAKADLTGQPHNFFIPITKVDAQKHQVWGWAATETPDHANEIMDYDSSKPRWEKWSQDTMARSGGKSLGNLRSMHKAIAAGKLIEFRPDDASKGIFVGAEVVDEEEWRKVEAGVYTGFSVGGSYVKRWPDQKLFGKTRYTADPLELSLVDAPCIPSATFQVIKMDGAEETRSFAPTNGQNILKADIPDSPRPLGSMGGLVGQPGEGGSVPVVEMPGKDKEVELDADKTLDAPPPGSILEDAHPGVQELDPPEGVEPEAGLKKLIPVKPREARMIKVRPARMLKVRKG